MAADAEQGRALDFVELVGGADRLEEARQHADPHPEALDDPDRVEQLMVGVAAAGGDQRPVHPVLGEQGLERVEAAQQGQFVDARVVGAERDAPHHLHPGPVAALHLGGEPVGGLGVADDDAALLGDEGAGQGPGQAAHQQHQEEQEPPEDRRLRAPEGPLDDVGAGEERQQGVEGGDVEDRGRLVEGALVEQVLVAVIQPGQLADRDHHRDRDDGPEPERVVAEDRDGDDEGGRGGDYVGRGEQPAVDAVAGGGGRRRVALGDGAALARPARCRPDPQRALPGRSGGGPCRLDRARWLSDASRIPPKHC